jgi:hypothetical protein
VITLNSKSEFEAFRKILTEVNLNSYFDGESFDLINVALSITFSQEGWNGFLDFINLWSYNFPELSEFGWNRAKRAYESKNHSITKPSYRLRLDGFVCTNKKGESETIDQISIICKRLTSNRCASGACFSVFNPIDNIEGYRPGYVPCVHGGMFRIKNGQLLFSVWFRSQSVLEFGIQDIFYLRSLQIEVLERLIQINSSLVDLEIGEICLFFGRIFIPRRVVRRKRSHMSGKKMLNEAILLIDSMNFG